MIVDAIPQSLKDSIAGGIGLFIAFIGLLQSGIIEKSPRGIFCFSLSLLILRELLKIIHFPRKI